MLLKQHKYGDVELSEILRRSEGAIVRRCNDLGLKERPVRADNHGKASVWTDADYQALADGIRHGDSYPVIGKAVGRSEKAVRGKVYFTYLTEDADKIRTMLKDGPWGFGAAGSRPCGRASISHGHGQRCGRISQFWMRCCESG